MRRLVRSARAAQLFGHLAHPPVSSLRHKWDKVVMWSRTTTHRCLL